MRSLHILQAAAAVLLLSSCSKASDYLQQHAGEEIKLCRVEALKIDSPGYFEAPGTINISYNPDGNPVDMLFTFSSTFGFNYENHFRYDKHSRLTDFLINYAFTDYPATDALLWHRYTYVGKNIVVDSFFDYGDMPLNAPNPTLSSFTRLIVFQLDNEGRIIKSSPPPPALPWEIITYQYDRKGNLVKAGVVYDDKVNPYRTNTVWRFINQDYSVNNPLPPSPTGPLPPYSDFNAFGLPQVITAWGHLFTYNFSRMNITYACSMTDPPVTPK